MPRPGLALVIRTQWDRTAAYSLIAVACTVFILGDIGLTHSPYGAEEVTYLISGGLGALVVLGMAVSLLLIADFRDHHLKLRRLNQAVRGHPLANTGISRAITGLAVAVMAGGLALFGFGLRDASSTAHLDRALDGLALAGAAVGLSSAALTVAVVTLRRRISSDSATVLERIAELAGISNLGIGPATTGPSEPDTALWTAPGLRRFHRPSCPALHSKTGEPHVVSGAAAGLEPCLLCSSQGAPHA
jgi:hypothetical protein